MIENDILQELRNEAIDTVEDRLGILNTAVESYTEGSLDGATFFATIKREAHSLKSVAASFEMKALLMVCHRFEDYIFDHKDISDTLVKNTQVYTDRMADSLEAFVHTIDIDISRLMRELPAKGGFDIEEVSVTDIEVMLVMEPGTATKIVTRELLECGYRMINVASTMDAIQLIPSMRPDLVIVSRVMPELSGVDLACALKAMPTTRGIPVALIAAANKNSDDLKDLPSDVPILRKGSKFGDDVADVFVELGIL